MLASLPSPHGQAQQPKLDSVSQTNEPVKAYAKLFGEGDFVYYLKSLDISLGRDAETDEQGADLQLGPSTNTALIAARIKYNSMIGVFELHSYMSSGVYLDGLHIPKGCAPAALYSKALIQIGSRLLYFLLPKTSVPVLKRGDIEDLYEGVQQTQRWAWEGQDCSNPAGVSLTLPSFWGPGGAPSFNKWKRGNREKFRLSFLKWGFGRWENVWKECGELNRTNEEIQLFALCFLRQLGKNLDKDDPEYSSYFASVQEMIERISQCGFFPPDSEDASLTEWNTLKKSTKKNIARLRLLFTLKEAMDRYGSEHLLDGLPQKTTSAKDGWSKNADRDILVGIHEHGWGSWDEIRQDPKLCFAEHFTSDVLMAQNSDKALFPPPMTLISTVKRLIEAIKERDDKIRGLFQTFNEAQKIQNTVNVGESQYLGGDWDKSSQSGKKRKSSDVDSKPAKKIKGSWSRKDLQYFQKGIMATGIPQSWEEFKLAFPRLRERNHKSLHQLLLSHIENVNKLLKIELSVPSTLLTAQDEKAELDPMPRFFIKTRTASLFKERVDLMERIRFVIAQPDYEQRVKDLVPDSILPEWWDNECDFSIVRGLLQYGFPNWERIVPDTSYPFKNLGVIISTPPDPQPILKRIEQISYLYARQSSPLQAFAVAAPVAAAVSDASSLGSLKSSGAVMATTAMVKSENTEDEVDDEATASDIDEEDDDDDDDDDGDQTDSNSMQTD